MTTATFFDAPPTINVANARYTVFQGATLLGTFTLKELAKSPPQYLSQEAVSHLIAHPRASRIVRPRSVEKGGNLVIKKANSETL